MQNIKNSNKNSQKNSKQNSSQNNQVRIIAGNLRSRIIKFANVNNKNNIALRPTPDRVRETLFNCLGQDLSNCKCLDLFAGSGILSFESLSRNAEQISINDINKLVVNNIKSNLEMLTRQNLSEINKVVIYNLDALLLLKILSQQQQIFDIIFIDPPYHSNLVSQILNSNLLLKICHQQTQIYVESAQKISYTNNNFELKKYIKAGEVNAHIFIPKTIFHEKSKKIFQNLVEIVEK